MDVQNLHLIRQYFTCRAIGVGEGSAEATLALHGHWLEEMESSIQPKSIHSVFNFKKREDGWG